MPSADWGSASARPRGRRPCPARPPLPVRRGMGLVHEIRGGDTKEPAVAALRRFIREFGYGRPEVKVLNYWEERPFVVVDLRVKWLAMTRDAGRSACCCCRATARRPSPRGCGSRRAGCFWMRTPRAALRPAPTAGWPSTWRPITATRLLFVLRRAATCRCCPTRPTRCWSTILSWAGRPWHHGDALAVGADAHTRPTTCCRSAPGIRHRTPFGPFQIRPWATARSR